MNSAGPWLRADDRVHLHHGEFEATVLVTRPDLGLHDLRFRGSAVGAVNLLAPRFDDSTSSMPATVEDCFIRGRDLVVTYAQRTDLPVRLQVYWRALSQSNDGEQCAGIDVQVSVQTSVLAATPALRIVSLLPAKAPAHHIADESHPARDVESLDLRRIGYWHCPLPNIALAYGEMLHPADIDRVEVDTREAGRVAIVHHTFAMPLEKGVILRARARGVLVAASGSRATLSAMYDDFLAADLPLTT